MFKKFGTLALTAALAVLGIQAAPANAAGLDAAPEAISGAYSNFSFVIDKATNSFSVPTGVSSGNLNVGWSLRGEDLVANAGKTLSVSGTLTKPDGTSTAVTDNSTGNVMMNVSTPTGPVSANPGTPSLTIPGNGTSGDVSITMSLSGWNQQTGETLPVQSGTYTLDVQLKVDGVAVTNGTDMGQAWWLRTYAYSISFSGTSAVAPTGATSLYANSSVCVDSSKITVGSTLNAKAFVNGVEKNTGGFSWEYRGYTSMWRSNSNGPQSTTVTNDDITNGLAARISLSENVTPGQTYETTYQVLQDGVDVTGTCTPAVPGKPTLALVNGNLVASGTLPAFADEMSTDCQLFDAAAPTVVVATKTNVYANMGSYNCIFTAGTVGGHNYFVKARAGLNMGSKSEWSVASDTVTKLSAGVSFSTPISGVSNEGGKISALSTSIAADETAGLISSVSDGASGIFSIATNSEADCCGGSIVTGFKVRHLTTAGVDSTFAGTGTLDIAPGQNNFATNGRFAWYGAKDKFVFTNASYPMTAQGAPEFKITTGSMNSATVSTMTVPSSVFNAACVAEVGAGYSAVSQGGMMSPPFVNATPVSAPTSTPLYVMNCAKMVSLPGNIGMQLGIPVLFSVTDATTLNIVKVFGAISDTVNAATVQFSVNPNAGAGDAAITAFARTYLQTGMSTSTTATRSIFTIKKDLTVTDTGATWTSTGATETGLRIAALNDGTVWGAMQDSATAGRLFKMVGSTVTETAITVDSNAAFTSTYFVMPSGIQAGNSPLVTVVRQNSVSTNTLTAAALATIDTTSGNMTTYEVAKFNYVIGNGAFSSYLVDSKNLYWFATEATNSSKYTVYRWRDPAYVAQAAVDQTITWTTSPTSIAKAGSVTVAATASSGLAVTYGTTDATKCTVNASTGVVTAVAASGTCTITANQAGNASFNAAAQKTLTLTITVPAPAKKTPKVPTVISKVKIGKTITVILHASKGTASKGANADGLATVVSASSASKAFCTVAKVIKNKKITGYTVKGLKAGKCSVVVTITGSSTYNSLTKTTVVTVTK